MCYVKVRSHPAPISATPASAMSAADGLLSGVAAVGPVKLERLNNDTLLAVTESMNQLAGSTSEQDSWLDDILALSAPIDFTPSPVSTSSPNTDTNGNWMRWLEDMSATSIRDNVPSAPEVLPMMPQMAEAVLVTPSPDMKESFFIPVEPLVSKKRPAAGHPSPSSSETEVGESSLKRQKNTEAARKSRARKAARVDFLEGEVDRLEQTGNLLRTRIAVLESDAKSFEEREMELKTRVARLERQLADSHKALLMQAEKPSSWGVQQGIVA